MLNNNQKNVIGTLSVNGKIKIITDNNEEIELWPFLKPMFYFLNTRKVSKLHIQEKEFSSYSLAYDGGSEKKLFFDAGHKKLTLQSAESCLDLSEDLNNFFNQLSGKKIVVAVNTCASPKCQSPARALSVNIYWDQKNPTAESVKETLKFLNSRMNSLFMET